MYSFVGKQTAETDIFPEATGFMVMVEGPDIGLMMSFVKGLPEKTAIPELQPLTEQVQS